MLPCNVFGNLFWCCLAVACGDLCVLMTAIALCLEPAGTTPSPLWTLLLSSSPSSKHTFVLCAFAMLNEVRSNPFCQYCSHLVSRLFGAAHIKGVRRGVQMSQCFQRSDEDAKLAYTRHGNVPVMHMYEMLSLTNQKVVEYTSQRAVLMLRNAWSTVIKQC